MDRLWNSNYCKVMTANFALFFAFYLLTPLLPLYLHETFGATKDVIGLVLSGYTLTALLFRPFSGYLVDSFPRKTVLLTVYAAFAIFFAGYLAASSLLLFTVVRTLHGGPFGAVTVANSTVAIDVLPSSRRNEGIGYYGLSNNLAMAISPTFAIFVYTQTQNFQLLFWLAFAVALFGLIVDSTVKVRRGESADAKSARGTGTWFMLCSVGLILSRLQGGKALREGRLTHNASEGMVISLVGYTLFILLPTVAEAFMSQMQSFKSDNVFVLNYAMLGLAGYYSSALLIGLGNGHLWPAFQNMMISMARHNERGTANSTILVSWDVGMGLGVLLGGIIAELMSYATAFWFVAVVNAAGVLLYFLRTRRFYLEGVEKVTARN